MRGGKSKENVCYVKPVSGKVSRLPYTHSAIGKAGELSGDVTLMDTWTERGRKGRVLVWRVGDRRM